MNSANMSTVKLPAYKINKKFKKPVAYFCMEYAIDQSLKLYSGGLGFLAGSHMRSAYPLGQNMVGIGMLWKYGYYDQVRDEEQLAREALAKKEYSFLEDTGIIFQVPVHGKLVHVKAYYLAPDTFGTAPLFLLSTDIPENDYLARTITHRLYNPNEAAKIAASIILGVGGGMLLDLLKFEPEIYHINEGHALPILCYLQSKYNDLEKVKERFVFTTHTPEEAGNESHSLSLLKEMSFFYTLSPDQIREIVRDDSHTLNYTLTALRFAKLANGVSKIHKNTSNDMWGSHADICEIIPITNAQNQKYWQDATLAKALQSENDELLLTRKRELKMQLFDVVADQTGKLFNPEVLTIVWARRFAGYKRANLIMRDYARFLDLISRNDHSIQMIWAGKPYPKDDENMNLFNSLIQQTAHLKNCAVLTGYEMKLSGILKRGADVWLNNPRYPREASGTSGMTAAMNGAINFSIDDGWFPEFAKHGVNSYVIPHSMASNLEILDQEDAQKLVSILTDEIIPTFYDHKDTWLNIIKNGMKDVAPAFDSDRMATEYYEKLYR